MAHHEFHMPVTEAQVRALRVGDTVTLHNTLFGIRDATQIHMFDRDRKTHFDMKGHAVIHTAPNVKKVPVSNEYPAGYASVCIGTTTSARMERFSRPLMEQYGVRLIIGKGGLGNTHFATSTHQACAVTKRAIAGSPTLRSALCMVAASGMPTRNGVRCRPCAPKVPSRSW